MNIQNNRNYFFWKMISGCFFIASLFSISSCSDPEEPEFRIELYKTEHADSFYKQIECCSAIIDSLAKIQKILDPIDSTTPLIEIAAKRNRGLKTEAGKRKAPLRGNHFNSLINIHDSVVLGFCDGRDTVAINKLLNGNECAVCIQKKLKLKWLPENNYRGFALVALKEEKPVFTLDTGAIESFYFLLMEDLEGFFARVEKAKGMKYALFIHINEQASKNIEQLMKKDTMARYFFLSNNKRLKFYAPRGHLDADNQMSIQTPLYFSQAEADKFKKEYRGKVRFSGGKPNWKRFFNIR